MDTVDWLKLLTSLGGGGVLTWLGRRRLGSTWRSICAVLAANRRLTECEGQRDDAIRTRDYLRTALTEITEAAAHVKAAHEAGRLTPTPSDASPSAPGASPATSTASPTKPSGAADR